MSKRLVNLLCLVVLLLLLNFSPLCMILFDRYFQIALSIYFWCLVIHLNNSIKTIDNQREA